MKISFIFMITLPMFSFETVRVINFECAQYADTGQAPTSVILTKTPAEELPARFILCSSTKQSKIDGKSPYMISGEDGSPWLAFSFSSTGLWVDVANGTVRKLFAPPNPGTHVWMHICADINSLTGNISVSLNGQPSVTVTALKLKKNRPQTLKNKFEIGLTKAATQTNSQYFGSVANINIFYHDSTQSVEAMSESTFENGNYMSWSRIEFNKKGKNVKIGKETVWDGAEQSYSILLPVKASWTQADTYCKTLGQGRMTEIQTLEGLKNLAIWVRKTEESCVKLWMPISDEVTEGVYINSNQGTKQTFLPWIPGQPDGGTQQNYVGFYLQESAFYDRDYDQLCVSCTLSRANQFKLRGLCTDTYLGNGLM